MAKGTYRQKRDKVLDELEDHDPEWATQLRAMRSTNPQAFRKEILRADVVLGAKLGRPTTLSMRPKRFGGEEDPVLVRRVQELRKHHKRADHPMDVPGRNRQGTLHPTPDMAELDDTRGGFVQDHTPALEHGDIDTSPLGQGLQGRSPVAEQPDLGPADGTRIQDRTPKAALDDPSGARADGQRLRSRSSKFDADLAPAQGHFARGRAPEDRPDLSAVEATKAGAPDLSILKGSVAAIKKALASGRFDAHLDAVEAAESAGKSRKGVLSAIQARR